MTLIIIFQNSKNYILNKLIVKIKMGVCTIFGESSTYDKCLHKRIPIDKLQAFLYLLKLLLFFFIIFN